MGFSVSKLIACILVPGSSFLSLDKTGELMTGGVAETFEWLDGFMLLRLTHLLR